MAVTAKLYSKHFSSLYGVLPASTAASYLTTTGTVQQIKCGLLANTYTPAQTTHKFWNDVNANELAAAGGYSTGGTVINTAATLTETLSWNVKYADAAWSSATFTARYAVVYAAGPSASPYAASAAPLILYVDFGADQTVSSGTFTVQWNASGTLAITVS